MCSITATKVEIVGIASCKEASPGIPRPTITAGWPVDIRPVRKLKSRFRFAVPKADKRFADMDLLRLGRLGVQTVKPAEWG